MGVDTTRFHAGRRDEKLRGRLGARGPLVLFVGRLAEKKGVRYLLEAMPKVIEKFPDTTLVIVGDGSLRGELEALAERLYIPSQVRFVVHKDVARNDIEKVIQCVERLTADN